MHGLGGASPADQAFAPRALTARRRPFFEGWYYKLVAADRRTCTAVIPGVFLGRRPARSYSFVQFVDGVTGRVVATEYPIGQVVAADGGGVAIGPNVFTPGRLGVRFAGVEGDLVFRDLSPWPRRLLAPGAMGWFAWLPGLQCYHGVVSLRHAVDGVLEVDGCAYDFTGGVGYLEKTWGGSFPRAWVWVQCNHFDVPGVSLFFTTASVPLAGGWFRGVTAGVLVGGNVHRLGTYSGAVIRRAEACPGLLTFEVRDRWTRLLVRARLPGDGEPNGDLVLSPAAEGLRPAIHEFLHAEVEFELSGRGGATVRGKGSPAFVDVVRPELLLR